MMRSLHPEVLLAAGYALFLILVAAGLEWFGRHSHRRSGQFRTAGFRYHRQLDAWECPCGQHLHRQPDHPKRRMARYRAPAHACNACHRKVDCTDSDQGREITVSVGSWIASEAGRFHRAMSLVLLILAAFILVVEVFRCHTVSELWVVGCSLSLVAMVKLRLIRELSSAPSVEKERPL
jgi:hypothetical protein